MMPRPFDNESETAELLPLRAGRSKAELFEVIVFLFLIVPTIVLSFFAQKQANASFDLIAAATILRDLALVSLIAYFLWRNQEPMIRIGWTSVAAAREIMLGVALFIPLAILAAIVETFLRSSGFTGTPKSVTGLLTPKGPWEIVLALLLVATAAVAEETIFRGYLILRFEAITGSSVTAALLATIIFSIGHGYEGTAGVATVGLLGLGFAAVYLWRRSLVAPIVMHFLQDFMAIVLVPLLTHRH